MADGKSLKEQNTWLIRAVMIGHIVAFTWVVTDPLRLPSLSGAALAAKLETAAAPGTAALGLIVVASMLLLGVIGPLWRDRLIHRRWQDTLPGCRAFTQVGPESSHVNMSALEEKFGPLPEGAMSRTGCSLRSIGRIATTLASSMRMAAISPRVTAGRSPRC